MFRIGSGWDRHRFAEGRKFVLGGVEFPEAEKGLLGHSDADALSHAICDAMLGAMALGDIGQHFPDTDPRWKDAHSLVFLKEARHLIAKSGYKLVNVDATVICEEPKINPRSLEIRESLAAVLELPVGQVSVKATRGEGMGPEGRGECLTVQAVVLLEKS
jgi:2-C-methyl-D-erythritol 2,4-cyclodiphosphate synthase